MSKPLVIMIVLSFLFFQMACGSRHSVQSIEVKKNTNTKLSGRGANSSAQQVRESVQKIWRYSTEKYNFVDPLVVKSDIFMSAFFAKVSALNPKTDLRVKAQLVFLGKSVDDSVFPSKPVEYLAESKLLIKEYGPCGIDGHRAASVSENAIGGEVCFSVPELKKIDSKELDSVVIGLLAHQMMHLQGYGEEDASSIEKLINANSRKSRSLSLFELENQISYAADSFERDLQNVASSLKSKLARELPPSPTFLLESIEAVSNDPLIFINFRPCTWTDAYGLGVEARHLAELTKRQEKKKVVSEEELEIELVSIHNIKTYLANHIANNDPESKRHLESLGLSGLQDPSVTPEPMSGAAP